MTDSYQPSEDDINRLLEERKSNDRELARELLRTRYELAQSAVRYKRLTALIERFKKGLA